MPSAAARSRRARARRRWTAGVASALLAAALELIGVVGEQHVEAGERAVAAGDVALELHLQIRVDLERVDLLLERPQPVPDHHDLVEERLDRPGLLLERGVAGPEDQRAAAPAIGRGHGREAGLLADDAAQERFELDGTVHGNLDDERRIGAFLRGHRRKRITGTRRGRLAAGRGRLAARGRGTRGRAARARNLARRGIGHAGGVAPAAAPGVLAAAVVALDAE